MTQTNTTTTHVERLRLELKEALQLDLLDDYGLA